MRMVVWGNRSWRAIERRWLCVLFSDLEFGFLTAWDKEQLKMLRHNFMVGCGVPQGVKLKWLLVWYYYYYHHTQQPSYPSLIPEIIIRATSATKNKIHLALLPEWKRATMRVGGWPYHLGLVAIEGNIIHSPIFSCGTWLRGTVQVFALIWHPVVSYHRRLPSPSPRNSAPWKSPCITHMVMPALK